MRCMAQHRVVWTLLAFACLTLVLIRTPQAQVRGKSAPSGTKALAPSATPRQDEITVNAKSAMLIEAVSGQVLASQNKDEQIAPASFVKLLTLYIAHDMLKSGKIKLTDEVYISKKAWETGGSKMFVELGSKVPLEELLKGIAIVSGNDACVAVAEHIAGSLDVFVKIMNETAQKLGMSNSHFENPHGLPSPQQYTTAHDMAVLARSYVTTFPEALRMHSTQEYTYSGIRQYNRNHLLRKDASIDGLKTGFIAEAGYHLVATAKRDERRLIAVVMGARSPAVREEEALKLLNYGYRHFAFVSVFTKGQILAVLPVWKGKSNALPIVAREEGMIVLPAEQKKRLEHEKILPEYVVAPIATDQVIGQYVVKVGSTVLRSIPLVAQNDVPKAGFVKVLLDSVLYFLGRIKIVTYILLAFGLVALALFTLKLLTRLRRRKVRVRY